MEKIQFDMSSALRRWLKEAVYIFFLAASIAMLGGIVMNFVIKDQFTASTTLVVNTKQVTNSTMRVKSASDTAASFQEVINTNILQKKVAEEMGIDRLPGSVQCTQIPNTNLLTLTVTSTSPKDVVSVMNGVLEHYDVVMDSLLGETVIQVLDAMYVPNESVTGADQWKMMIKIFLGVFVVLSGCLVLYDMLQDDIKNENEVEQKLDTKLFSTVYYEKIQFGLKQLFGKEKHTELTITNPLIGFSFTETYQKIATKVEYSLGREKKVLLITSMKEDEGKSTVAANLALTLAQRDKKVLLVDGDLRNPTQYKIFHLTYGDDSKQIDDWLSGNASVSEAAIYKKETQLSVLGGSRSASDTGELLRYDRLKRLFEQLRSEFDYIILDTPPLLSVADTEELLTVSDAGLIVVRQNASKVKDINDGIDLFTGASCELFGCIFNGVKDLPHLGSKGGYYYYNKRYGYGYRGYGYHKSRYGYGYGKRLQEQQVKENSQNNDKEQEKDE